MKTSNLAIVSVLLWSAMGVVADDASDKDGKPPLSVQPRKATPEGAKASRADEEVAVAAHQLPPEIRAFAAAKERQAKALEKKLGYELSPDVWSFFNAAKAGDWDAMRELWEDLRLRAGQYEGSTSDPAVATPLWSTVLETDVAAEQFALGEPKYAFAFGRDIIKSIPAGSIYFGGTDPGRGLVTALCASHEKGDPFFTLTQNALADNNYLTYLRETYGQRLHMLTEKDSERAFETYMTDARNRLEKGQLKPGEDVRVVDGTVRVSGQVSVMIINGLLAKTIFDNNPDREFFLEESFPLEWMYPHLVPNGLILKLHRQPLKTISAEVIAADQKYWNERLKVMVGGWLKPETPVKTVCEFSDKIFLGKDLSGFKGDPSFVRNDYACRTYSKLRGAIAGVYAWRAAQAKGAEEAKRMRQAAGYAFRQAIALCPYNPETVLRYVNLLLQDAKTEDALLVAQTALKLQPHNMGLRNMTRQLRSSMNGGPTPVDPDEDEKN